MVYYRVEEETTEGLAAADPFEGNGAFLAMRAEAGEILAALEAAFGRAVPAVACPMAGAWVDTRLLEGNREQVVAAWERAHA